VATAEAIADFRLLIDEQADKLPYTDARLGERIDTAASIQALASEIWLEKAAAYAALVNTSESGSSRSLSDLQKQALTMAETFSKLDPSAPGTGTAARGVRMRRLTR
jgi:hypothetical protein